MMRIRLALVAVALAGAATACEPPPPPTLLEVTSTGPGHDATPGDGVCEDDNGYCTLQAAFDEANALGRARITVLAEQYESLSVHLTADVEIGLADHVDPSESALIGGMSPGSGLDLHIAPEGSLSSRLIEYSGGSVIVEGGLAGDRFAAVGGTLHVFPTGTVILRNALVGPVENEGRLLLTAATVDGRHDAPGLTTSGSGVTYLAATAVLAPPEASACAGTVPVSLGYNLSQDTSCELSGTGDLGGDPAGTDIYPAPGSPRIDAVPVGVHGCGVDLVIDIAGNPRPMDGIGDGIAACDIGAWERLHWT